MGLSDHNINEYTQRVVKKIIRRGSHTVEVTVSPREMEKIRAEQIAAFLREHGTPSEEITQPKDKLYKNNQQVTIDDQSLDPPPRDDVSTGYAVMPKYSSRIQSLLFPPHLRESVLGDQEEIFRKDVSKHGRAWAVWLYRWDTFIAMCSWMKKMASFSAIAGLGGAVLKWLGAGG